MTSTKIFCPVSVRNPYFPAALLRIQLIIAGTVTSDTKQYAETAIKELAGFGENSFQGLLVILTNDKYEKAGSEDTPEFRGARESASRILLNLGLNSSKKAEDIQGLVDKLNSVYLKLLSLLQHTNPH